MSSSMYDDFDEIAYQVYIEGVEQDEEPQEYNEGDDND